MEKRDFGETRPREGEKAGIYVHVPFCAKKCPYCDFYSIVGSAFIKDFVRAVQMEMAMTPSPGLFFDTLYFGGGTPSLIEPGDIGAIIEAARKKYDFPALAEITLEANPGTVTEERLRHYRIAGVNRINIGTQSFSSRNLTFLGRIHSPGQGKNAIRFARKAGFDNLGLDLIYGLPGQDESMWLEDLTQAVGLEPEHISCYMLTFEPGTPMDLNRRKGDFTPCPDDRMAGLFETTVDFLSAGGYFHYETSNFAKTGVSGKNPGNRNRYQSRHNRKYWSGVSYLGFGPSAHSFLPPVRYWNIKSVTQYLNCINRGHTPVAEKETLTREQQMMEAVYLGLRTADGIDIGKFEQKFKADFYTMFQEPLSELVDQGLLVFSGENVRLLPRGMTLLDAIAGRIFEYLVF